MSDRVGRALAIKSVGKQVNQAFIDENYEDAWYKERWLRKLENMTAKEFEEQYADTGD